MLILEIRPIVFAEEEMTIADALRLGDFDASPGILIVYFNWLVELGLLVLDEDEKTYRLTDSGKLLNREVGSDMLNILEKHQRMIYDKTRH